MLTRGGDLTNEQQDVSNLLSGLNSNGDVLQLKSYPVEGAELTYAGLSYELR